MAATTNDVIALLRNLEVPEGWNGTEALRARLIDFFAKAPQSLADRQALDGVLLNLLASHIEVARYIGDLESALKGLTDTFGPK